MDTKTLKVEALCWLRFGKKCPYIATEVGKWNADIMGVDETYSIEIEVKTSRSDMMREFTHKASKHGLYKASAEGKPYTNFVPNYFYFYVPEKLEEAARAIVGEKMPHAGIAVYTGGHVKDGDKTRVVKRATRIHDNPPSEALRRAILWRMGSELCGRHIAYRDFCQEIVVGAKDLDAAAFVSALDKFGVDVAAAIAALPSTLDPEEKANDQDNEEGANR